MSEWLTLFAEGGVYTLTRYDTKTQIKKQPNPTGKEKLPSDEFMVT